MDMREFLIVGSKPTKIYNSYMMYGIMKLSKNFIKLNLFKLDLFHLTKFGLIFQNKINVGLLLYPQPILKGLNWNFIQKLRKYLKYELDKF